jgi:WD40 repeat protein/serine/threonine protein kinase
MAAKKTNPEDIFHKAIEISDQAERVEYLDKACAGDEKLRAEVEFLLKSHEQAGDFLESLAIDPDVTLDETPLAEGPETVIGRYKLLEKIGEGGMASVYMAEQKRPIRRRVALKIIKLGMDTKQVIARFEAERQALAMMDHPNIAKVLDAGTTDTGRPYFVMELVRGVAITEFCDKNNLSTSERLELFVSVCQAVQHAHQKGIIHRDIKPSNVMVTLHDGQPVVKVIDFGIAKAVNQQLTEKTVFTRYSQMIGTPEYMSPEQAEMSGLDIDTRTDVFSLGVLLYELLTGTTPFDSEYLLKKGYGEMQRIIREEEPIRPSTRISTLGETITDVAKHRRTSPELLCKLIRSDLDWIVMKTMEKNRNRRYESVSEFTADIKRHLNNEPVLAGRPSTVYRVQKFIKRNKLLVTSAAVIVIILVVATSVSLWQMVRANRAAEQLKVEKENAESAEQQARTAEQTVTIERDRAEESEKDARLNLYAADIKAAQQNIDDGNIGAALTLLKAYEGLTSEDDIRGWEWRYLWKRAQGDPVQRFVEHKSTVTCVAFSPDGKLLASGSEDHTVIVRDMTGNVLLRAQASNAIRSVSFSNDGLYFAAADTGGKVLIWRTRGFELFRESYEQQYGCASAVFSPSEATLAVAYANGIVALWDFTANSTGTRLDLSREKNSKKEQSGDSELPISIAAFSDDGKYLATFASGSGRFDIWNIRTSRWVTSLEDFQGAPFLWREHVTFVPERNTLFLGDIVNGSLLWDFESGDITIPINKTVACNIVQAVANSKGTLMVTVGYDHAARLWEVSGDSFQEKACLLGHTSQVYAVAMASDDMQFATGGFDNKVLLWDIEPKQTVTKVSSHFLPCKPSFSKDGQLAVLATGDLSNFRTRLYDLEEANFLDTEISGYPIGFAEDETEIVLLTEAAGSLGLAKWNLAKNRTTWETDLWPAPGMGSSLLAVCKHRKLFASGRSDGSVIIGNWGDGTRIKVLKAHEEIVGAVAFSPDGRLLLTADGTYNTVDSLAVVWSCNDLDAIEKRYEIRAHGNYMSSAAFSPDSAVLATGGGDSRILLWDAATGDLRQELVGQKQEVTGLAFSPDGRTLMSASGETIMGWHIATGRELIKLHLDSEALYVAFSPDGNIVAAMAGTNPYSPEELYIWRAPSLKEIDSSRQHGSTVN